MQCTPGTLAGLRIGQTATLATSLVVREDSLTLFGFAGRRREAVFELLQTASGVGPRLAQAMLAVHSPDGCAWPWRPTTQDADRVPGIGQKGAQRIILELKDRLGSPVGHVRNGTRAGRRRPLEATRCMQALVGLGWSAKDADRPSRRSRREAAATTPQVAGLLRSALRTLSRA